MEARFPKDDKGQRLPMYLVAKGCDVDGSDDDRETALADLKNFTAPPEVRDVEKWLAELSAITAGRGKEGFDAELMINAYSARLRDYPADVVRYALLKESWKWFPTWNELEAVCRAKAGPRLAMIAALSKPKEESGPERRAPYAEERARMAAYISERFPGISPNEILTAVDAEMDRTLEANKTQGKTND